MLTAQVGETVPVGPESIAQVTPDPVPAGSGSSSVTFYAVPVPAAFEFATVIENPIGSPAFTVA